MTALPSFVINAYASLRLIKPNWPASGSVASFLSSSVYKAGTPAVAEAISKAFAGSEGLRKAFSQTYDAVMQLDASKYGQLAHPNNVRHIALVETITANRGDFPPEEFTIHTDLPDGASITTTIPSAAAMKGDTFKAWIAQKQESFDAAKAADEQQPAAGDDTGIAIEALSKVIESLVLKNGDAPLDLLNGEDRQSAVSSQFLIH